MSKLRLEAFSDAVIAIAITIMVLELRVPHSPDLATLQPLLPPFLTYVLSFIYLGIYWTNHHHLLHAAERVNGKILWANLHLLFWLSLIPIVTGWMGENHFAPLPVAMYGAVLFIASVAWLILQTTIVDHHGQSSKLRAALGCDFKGKLSSALYVASIPLAFLNCWISIAIYVFVALMWLVPDRRFERAVGS